MQLPHLLLFKNVEKYFKEYLQLGLSLCSIVFSFRFVRTAYWFRTNENRISSTVRMINLSWSISHAKSEGHENFVWPNSPTNWKMNYAVHNSKILLLMQIWQHALQKIIILLMGPTTKQKKNHFYIVLASYKPLPGVHSALSIVGFLITHI